ncbi:MAG TPA: menaquinone biosynthesis protein [Pirellulales bacterium]|jgi:chorismate dehydratase|nr:menaquinone biosynthesis protein [Pirellulales bacterium]
MNAAKIRVGAVNYLNTKPLIYGLQAAAPEIDLVLDLPSRLADNLAAGRLDVALIPSVEYFQDSAYRIVSDACIGCRGPVLSVKLYFRVPPREVKTLALDEGSRTSAALSKILLKERFGVEPKLQPLPIGKSLADTSADAVLLIGDRAIHSPPGKFVQIWDLGDEWTKWSKLSFVFAMWVAREGAELAGVEAALGAARDRGLAHLDEIAQQESAALGLTVPQCLTYLRDHLYFHLGDREQQGLELFHRHAVQLGLAPEEANA